MGHRTAFSYGHALLRGGQPEEAAEVFNELLRINPKDEQATLMLARCKSEQEYHGACLELLEALFKNSDLSLAAEFHSAFVLRAAGMMDRAAQQMSNIVRQHHDLPIACLFLGDTLATDGQYKRAIECWKLAIARDQKGGAVAAAARKQLQALRKRREQKRTEAGKNQRRKKDAQAINEGE